MVIDESTSRQNPICAQHVKPRESTFNQSITCTRQQHGKVGASNLASQNCTTLVLGNVACKKGE